MKKNFKNKFILFTLTIQGLVSGSVWAGRSVSIPAIAIYDDFTFTKGDNPVSAFVNPLPTNLENWQNLCPGKGYNGTTTPIPGSITAASIPGVLPVVLPNPPIPTIEECGRGVRNDDLMFGADAILILSNISNVPQTVTLSITNPINIDPSFGDPTGATGLGIGTGALLPGEIGLLVGCVQGGTVSATPPPFHANSITSPWSTGNSETSQFVIGPGQTYGCIARYSYGYRSTSATYMTGSGTQWVRFLGAFRLDLTVAENLGAITGNINVAIGPNSRLMNADGKHPVPLKSYTVPVNGGRPF